MTQSTDSNHRLMPCIAWVFLIVCATGAEGERQRTKDPDVASRLPTSPRVTNRSAASVEDRRAEELYREKAGEIALRTDKAASSSQENAALLYYQALLAYREPDPCTAQILNAVSRGGEPDTRVRVYLGRSLNTIELAQIASQMPQCHWGPMRAGEQQLDFNLGIPLRRLSRLLDADARTLAADGHGRAALGRCLTMRRLARQAGDETYNLYSISQSIHTLALRAVAHILSTRQPNSETLMWLKSQLATVPGTPFEPTQALHKWRDAELQFWRTRPQGRAFTRELVLDKIPDANDKKDLTVLTDDQLLVIALQAEQRIPGRYGISAPPRLLERAQQVCDQYLDSALQVMQADLPYREKHGKLQAMVDSLDDRATDGDPIALLPDAPKAVEVYHRLTVRNAVYDNVVTVAIEVCLIKARTGRLPQSLPRGLPKDPYTNRDFQYERTDKGFSLRFDPDNLSRIQVRQSEFQTQDSTPRNP